METVSFLVYVLSGALLQQILTRDCVNAQTY